MVPNKINEYITKGLAKMKSVAIIPARVGSTRLARKPLLDICGLPMIAHVVARARLSEAFSAVVVATDSHEVADVARQFGARAVMTKEHRNGIERVAEVTASIECDAVVQINGDEPLFHPSHADAVLEALQSSRAPTALLATETTRYQNLSDHKIALDRENRVLYFSRVDIPHGSEGRGLAMMKAYHVIAFTRAALLQYPLLPVGPLELAEGHDHFRFLENGIPVQARVVDHVSTSVDTEEDASRVNDLMESDAVYRLYRNTY